MSAHQKKYPFDFKTQYGLGFNQQDDEIVVDFFCGGGGAGIPPLTDHGSDAHLVGAFAGTALWIVAGYSIAIYVIRKAPRAQG